MFGKMCVIQPEHTVMGSVSHNATWTTVVLLNKQYITITGIKKYRTIKVFLLLLLLHIVSV